MDFDPIFRGNRTAKPTDEKNPMGRMLIKNAYLHPWAGCAGVIKSVNNPK